MRVGTLVLFAALASAQWLHYATPGIPRTLEGKPNLSAPTPKTRDGRPDLSGIWLPQNDPGIKGTDGEPLPKLFLDVGSGAKQGEFMMLPAAEAIYEERVRTHQVTDPLTACKPLGGPRLDSLPSPIKIVQTPDLIVLLHEIENMFRQIHTDGRKLPGDPEPSALGYSVGHWERSTLVVETAGFRDHGWLDVFGHPFSDALHFTERIQRPDFGHLAIQITIDDPKTYKKPFTVTQNLNFLPDTDLLQYSCSENEQDAKHFVQ